MTAPWRYAAPLPFRRLLARSADMSATALSPPESTSHVSAESARWLPRGGLKAWQLRARTLLPVVQGGMGVGVSAHRLEGTVASLGGVGTISSVDLRHHTRRRSSSTGESMT